MSQNDYNPDSVDATLSRIEERQKDNSIKLDSFCAQMVRMQNEVRELQNWKFYVAGAAAAVGVIVHFIVDFFHKK